MGEEIVKVDGYDQMLEALHRLSIENPNTVAASYAGVDPSSQDGISVYVSHEKRNLRIVPADGIGEVVHGWVQRMGKAGLATVRGYRASIDLLAIEDHFQKPERQAALRKEKRHEWWRDRLATAVIALTAAVIGGLIQAWLSGDRASITDLQSRVEELEESRSQPGGSPAPPQSGSQPPDTQPMVRETGSTGTPARPDR